MATVKVFLADKQPPGVNIDGVAPCDMDEETYNALPEHVRRAVNESEFFADPAPAELPEGVLTVPCPSCGAPVPVPVPVEQTEVEATAEEETDPPHTVPAPGPSPDPGVEP